MFHSGIIEESLNSQEPLKALEFCFVRQRIEHIPGDEYPVWHTNEYHVPEDQISAVLNLLKGCIKPTWYLHAFNDKTLYVVLIGQCFNVSLQRDETWHEMIDYGVKVAKVRPQYLENIPLHI